MVASKDGLAEPVIRLPFPATIQRAAEMDNAIIFEASVFVTLDLLDLIVLNRRAQTIAVLQKIKDAASIMPVANVSMGGLVMVVPLKIVLKNVAVAENVH